MKIIEIDEELYQYIASQTQSIGESASDILRRLLNLPMRNFATAHLTNEPSENKEEDVSRLMLETESTQVARMAKPKAPKSSETIEDESFVVQKPKKQSEQAISHLAEKVRQLLNSAEFQQESKAVVRFLSLLTLLYRTNPESFAQATESLQGRTRVYFARDEGTLLMAGTHTKPKQIPDTPYWVITNTNSARKMLMLEGAMQSMHLPDELIEQVRGYFIVN